MATFANFVLVPCKINTTQDAVNQVDSAAVFRAPTPQPLGVAGSSGGATLPTGPQWWPLKG